MNNQDIGFRSEILEHIFLEHNGKVSDKWSMYIAEYDRLFQNYRNRPIYLLEIGVQNGGSLEIWGKYFPKAKKLIGCDINPDCAQLQFDDTRIALVVSDANTDGAQQQIQNLSPKFDLIIDDGSHRSSDIIHSFCRYFPVLANDGLYVAEDLHCSYWQEFEGGLFQPYSSIAFFKKLADLTNYEHWGVEKKRQDILAGFFNSYGVSIDENSLSHIHSIEFINSMCVVRKKAHMHNLLGARKVSGKKSIVRYMPDELIGAKNQTPSQIRNPWSILIKTSDEDLAAKKNEIIELKKTVADYEKKIKSLEENVFVKTLEFHSKMQLSLKNQLLNEQSYSQKLLFEIEENQEKDVLLAMQYIENSSSINHETEK
jgi:O-antigen biosynthesis protein